MNRNLALAAGGGLFAAGIGGLIWRQRQQKKTPPKPPSVWGVDRPPIYYASARQNSFDEEIGNGWRLLDARNFRVREIDTDKDIHLGNVTYLILQHGSGVPGKVFAARVIGISGDDFNGQWVGESPAGGPQMIEFRGAHIFEFHK